MQPFSMFCLQSLDVSAVISLLPGDGMDRHLFAAFSLMPPPPPPSQPPPAIK